MIVVVCFVLYRNELKVLFVIMTTVSLWWSIFTQLQKETFRPGPISVKILYYRA